MFCSNSNFYSNVSLVYVLSDKIRKYLDDFISKLFPANEENTFSLIVPQSFTLFVLSDATLLSSIDL